MTISLSLVDAPAEPAVTLADAKAFLHVWHDDDDAVIAQLIAAATDKLDGADGMLGRCILEQTWRMTLDCFPSGAIRLPLPPFREVVSITYLDTNGVEQTLPGSAYRATHGGVLSSTATWPDTAQISGAVSIIFTAGLDEAPASIKQVILALAFYWYENRGAAAIPALAGQEVPFGFDDLLTQWRTPRFD